MSLPKHANNGTDLLGLIDILDYLASLNSSANPEVELVFKGKRLQMKDGWWRPKKKRIKIVLEEV